MNAERARLRGVPRRFAGAELSGEQTPAICHVRSYLNTSAQQGGALVLLGPPGVGKSWALSAAVGAWPDAAFFLPVDLLAQAAARDRDGLGTLTTRAMSTSLLGLDDLGRLKPSGLTEAILEEVIVRRHADLQATMISSNWTPAEFTRRLSPRVVDRLREWSRVVVLEGPSLRRAEE